ncbi:retrovirus-related pol polyprotein from transposon TNT 1-94 [Tanacetum coccineum]
MSTSTTHQQSLADVGSETRPPMLERGSYVPWASQFIRYTEDDLRGDELLYYEAEIEAMNLILIFIPNDIYNSVDSCTTTKAMWKRFVAAPGEELVFVYNRFAQLMNDLERNDMNFALVTINIKFLNCLQPEWLKYVTQVCLAKRLIDDTFDDLFDYLQQFEKLVNASRAKKLEKSHDPLALVAHTGSSSRNTSSYYVTHPPSVVDYDEEYQKDVVQTNSEDPLTFAINSGNIGRNTRQAYVQKEVVEGSNAQNETENVQRTLRTSSLGNTTNVQCYNYSEKGHYARNCPKLRVRDLKYFMEQMLLAKQDEAGVILTDEQNDFLFADASRMEEIEELSVNICLMARIQPANTTSDAGPSYDSAFVSEVQSSSINNNQEQMYPTHTKIINCIIGDDQIDSNIIFDKLNGNVNSGSFEDDTHVPDLYKLEKLARNAYQEAKKQQLFAQKSNNKTRLDQADRKAKRFDQQAEAQFVRDRDIIRDLEHQRDKLDLAFIDYKWKNKELQKTHSILKRQISENEDSYHDTVLDLKAKLKKNVDLIMKLSNSLQGMFMLGPKPLSMYNSRLKHGLGYLNPYTLKQEISQCPKLYLASSLSNSEVSLDVRDTEDIFDDAFKSKNKMKEKMNDPIAVELSAEQKYFESSFIPSDKTSNATSSIPASIPNNSLHAEIEQIQRNSIEIQEGMQARIKVLEKDV